MTLTMQNRNTRRNASIIATLYTTNLTWTDVEPNPDLRCSLRKKPRSNINTKQLATPVLSVKCQFMRKLTNLLLYYPPTPNTVTWRCAW